MNKERNIRGHICNGLLYYRHSLDNYAPDFTVQGFVSCREASSSVPILYCPFCGEKLPEPRMYRYTCRDCGCIHDSYEEEYCCRECFSVDLDVSFDVGEL